MRKSRHFLALCSLCLSLSAGNAAAQDQAAAEALFRSAREAASQGDWITACDRFEESNRLEPAPGTVLNIGRCREKLGQLASAWKSYEEAAQRLPKEDRRRAFAKKRANALEERVPCMILRAPEGDAEFTVVVGETEFAAATLGVELPFDPGTLTITVRSAGREDWTQQIEIAEGDRVEQRLQIGAPLAEDVPVPTIEEDPTSDSEESGSDTLAYSMVGVGVVGLAAAIGGGIWIAVEAGPVNDNCSDGICRTQKGIDASNRGKVANVVTFAGLGVAAIGLGWGSYLLWGDDESSVAIAPQAGGGLLEFSSSF